MNNYLNAVLSKCPYPLNIHKYYHSVTGKTDYENLITGAYYFNQVTKGFLSVEPSEDGKTINYFETDFYSLNKKLLQTEILKPKPLPKEPTQ